MLRSLKFRFLSVVFFMLFAIVSLALVQHNYVKKVNHLYEAQLAIQELQLKSLQMELAKANFFLTHDTQYINDVEVYTNTIDSYLELVDEYLKEFAYPESLARNLELYLNTFTSITQLKEQNTKEYKKLTSTLENYAQEIDTYIDNEKTRLTPIITNKIDNITLFQNIIYIIMALVTIFMIIIVFKPIINSILILKQFFADYQNSKERLNIDKLCFHETKDIATFVNKMLDNQEVIQQELLLSRDEALRLQKVKDEFLSNMSHELRTPLNSICGFSEMLLRKLPNEKEIIHPIISSSQHLLQLVSDILDLSKIQSGKFEILEEPFALNKELLTFREYFSPLMDNKNILFTLNYSADEDIHLKGDWFRISQILNNFMSNAIKFTPENGQITLNVKYQDDHLSVAVKDSGIGIEQNALEKIVNPFEQSDNSIAKKFGGTGLGLSIAKTLTKMMGGEFTIESQIGVGSTFSISIPLELIEMKENLIKDEKFEDTEDEISIDAHILIAEDNKTNQLLLSMLLDDLKITYDMANDGQEALDIFKEDVYDIILMDENMPNLNGTESMLAIREKFPNVPPIIAVTANAMKGDRERLLAMGMDDFLSKPINNNLLIEVIRKNLTRS